MFACCGEEEKVQTGNAFTYWVSLPSAASQTLTSFNELLMYREICKRTGTQVDFIHPSAGSTGTEAFQIPLSSGDYPDMVEYNWKAYTGGPDHGRMIWGETGKPGYGLYDRALGAMYMAGIWETLDKLK